MAFSLVYSITKLLPDAKVYLHRITDNKPIDKQFFAWSSRLGVSNYKDIGEHFILNCNCLMVRPLESDEPIVCSEAKDDKFTPFVSYQGGCGKFVLDEWIHKEACPFPYAEGFMTYGCCSSEVMVLKLWKQMNTLYQFLGG